MNKIVLIPAYEPDSLLINLVDKLIPLYDVVVVDDGSTSDLIFNQIKDKVKVLSYSQNKGKGYALKHGLKYIKENYDKDDLVVCADADGQHSLEDIGKLFTKIKNNTFVIGIRTFSKEDTPLRSRIGNRLTSSIVKFYFKKYLKDTQSGLRGFKVELIDDLIKIEGNRYEYEMNQLFYLIKNDITIIEEEIKTIYYDNNKKSHFKTFKDSYIIYKQIKKNK